MYPENLDQEAITWIDYSGDAYFLAGASKDHNTITKSKEPTAEAGEGQHQISYQAYIRAW